jgi:hypothetical protein
MKLIGSFIFILVLHFDLVTGWLTIESALWAVRSFAADEKNRSAITFKGTDRRTSTPFISGDGFRSFCNHVCEDANRCRMDPLLVKDGECVFVKTDFFEFFVKEVANRIPGKYIIVSHNGDLSAPDGQDDAQRIGMPKYVVSDILAKEYEKGRLIAHHGQNLWWKNATVRPRPEFSHCLPIGFENRQYPTGKNVQAYAQALQDLVIDRPVQTVDEQTKKPLLLVAFYPKSRVPDRHKVLSILGVFPPKGTPKLENPFYNYTDLNHREWLEGIVTHRFVLAPFGHGLDTHRVSEILMMGGIPVMRRSTISSCFDDSDNTHYLQNGTAVTRGSLPVVIVDRWEDVTKERLEAEWTRLSAVRPEQWDWRRLFIHHWVERIFSPRFKPAKRS